MPFQNSAETAVSDDGDYNRENIMLRPLILALAGILPWAGSAISAEPVANPTLLDHSMRRLHSNEVVNLRERYAGKALLIVNTASFCGFTGQFAKLEALHRAYKDRGLAVIGFPSDDFRQEANDETKTAEVCFVNYGVTFDMYSTIPVRGDDAHPLFRALAAQSAAPRWNFYKYVVDREGRVLGRFSSMVEPDAAELRDTIEKAL